MSCQHTPLQNLLDFDHLTDPPVECPDCHQMVEVNYDETWDEESGDEWVWFYLSVAPLSAPSAD